MDILIDIVTMVNLFVFAMIGFFVGWRFSSLIKPTNIEISKYGITSPMIRIAFSVMGAYIALLAGIYIIANVAV
jgi:hypothetical protein